MGCSDLYFRKCGRFREREPKQRTYSEPWIPVARTRDSKPTSDEAAQDTLRVWIFQVTEPANCTQPTVTASIANIHTRKKDLDTS